MKNIISVLKAISFFVFGVVGIIFITYKGVNHYSYVNSVSKKNESSDRTIEKAYDKLAVDRDENNKKINEDKYDYEVSFPIVLDTHDISIPDYTFPEEIKNEIYTIYDYCFISDLREYPEAYDAFTHNHYESIRDGRNSVENNVYLRVKYNVKSDESKQYDYLISYMSLVHGYAPSDYENIQWDSFYIETDEVDAKGHLILEPYESKDLVVWYEFPIKLFEDEKIYAILQIDHYGLFHNTEYAYFLALDKSRIE